MKLKYAPFKNKEEKNLDRRLKYAANKHRKEFFNNPLNFGRPFFPLFITTRLLVAEEKKHVNS